MRTDKYCNVCGLELIEIPTGYYSTITGKKRTCKICPSGKCDHYGCGDHDFKTVEILIKRSFFFIKKYRYEAICKKCGFVMGVSKLQVGHM